MRRLAAALILALAACGAEEPPKPPALAVADVPPVGPAPSADFPPAPPGSFCIASRISLSPSRETPLRRFTPESLEIPNKP